MPRVTRPTQREGDERELRRRLRARLVARMARAQQATSPRDADRALREARIVATAADVLAYRERRGWSQYDLAAAVGTTRSEVAECERGRRPGWRVREWVDEQLAAVR